MSTKIDVEQSIKKFNTKFRKSTMWNPYGDETARFYKVSEEGYRKVSLGTGCILFTLLKIIVWKLLSFNQLAEESLAVFLTEEQSMALCICWSYQVS